MVSEPHLIVERDGPIATVTFNRPSVRNALSQEILDGVQRFFSSAATEAGLRAIVLRGAGGKAFSSGSDFADLRSAQERGIVPSTPDDPFERALGALSACPLPVIAMIQGFAVGGGCALATACDIRIASASARLGMPPAKLGILYSQNELAPFLDLVGPGRTKLLFYSARLLDAERALRIGLVDDVVADDEIEAYTAALAREIAGNAPLTVRNTKQIIRHLTARQLSEEQRAEVSRLIRETQGSQDFQEGQQAVLEKRLARFQGD